MEAMDVKYKPVMFPNGAAALKKAKPAAVAPAGEPLYRECLKNHAASLGGHAVDGCGEFMPSPGANPADPTSLKCASCGCHRNFHRRTLESSPPPPAPAPAPAPLALPAPPLPSVLHGQPQPHRGGEETPEDRHPGVVDADDSDSDSEGSEYDEERSLSPPPPPPHHVPAPVAQQPPPPSYFPTAPHMLLSLGSGAPGAAVAVAAQRLVPPAQQLTPSSAPPAGGAMPMPRKRFRTKFTAEQKQRMQELSERLGWRLQKRDEAIVDEWCRDIGVGKGVFKVWMHNNKHNFLGGHSARRSASSSAGAAPLQQTPAAGATAPSFHPSRITPPPPVLTSSPTAATGFNINGAASSEPTVTGDHTDKANGASSPHSA